MTPVERENLIRTWIAFQYAPKESAAQKDSLWAEHLLWQMCESEPKASLEVVLEVLKRDSSDKMLQCVAAGPLEDLLVAHGDSVIDSIEREAANNGQLRKALGGVWKSDIPDSVWAKVLTLAPERW